MYRSYVAIGDSFTEGMGDWWPDGAERGWADLVAYSLARASGDPGGFRYANLAIRGRKLGPLLDEQLDPAIAMAPDLVSVNGGGNDILRPRMDVSAVARQLVAATRRIVDSGRTALLLSGGDPSEHLPAGGTFRRRGTALTDAVRDLADGMPNVVFCDNFGDATLRGADRWSRDGLHLGTRGHARVACNVLTALGVVIPPEVAALQDAPAAPSSYGSLGYYREFVVPWIGRRLTGRSSGDHRVAKRPALSSLPTALGDATAAR